MAYDIEKKRAAWRRYYAKHRETLNLKCRERYHEKKALTAARNQQASSAETARKAAQAVADGVVPSTREQRIAAARARNSAKLRAAMGIA